MKILVAGLIGQYPFGGVTWDYIQYLLGFRSLGHEVWYLEDTGCWAYDPISQQPSQSCENNIRYLSKIMSDFEFGDSWIYRNAADNSYHGVNGLAQAEKVISDADVLVNVSGACWLTQLTGKVPHKIFIDGDPMFTQIGIMESTTSFDHVSAHQSHFTFGLNVGSSDCSVPACGINWKKTVQPISLSDWNLQAHANLSVQLSDCFTTVMNWSSYPPKIYDGVKYGQKGEEFLKFIDLPSKSAQRFVLAMGQGVGRSRPTAELEAHRWTILEPDEYIPDYLSYRTFLASSLGEWSIAKNGYVKSNSGWFSCRSACYLALGKPVVIQDTAWSRYLPSSLGLVAFSSFASATEGIANVCSELDAHSRAAKDIAGEVFSAEKVCSFLLEDISMF